MIEVSLIRRLVLAIAIALGSTSVSADEMRNVDVRFAPGTSGAFLSDTIVGYDSVLYRVGAEAGQTMRITLSSSNLATYFNVYEPGRGPEDEALANGQFTDALNNWSDTLVSSGEYTISVYMMRSAARRDERSDFSVDGATGAQVQNDFADGLSGGPDFFEVAVSGAGSLNMRSAPSSGSSVVTRLANGQNVRNLGCRMAEGGRWCRIATLADPGYKGWASGDFLIEGTGASAQMPSTSGDGMGGEERVSFAAGTSGAELTGVLFPGKTRRYVLGANSGQNLYARVAANGPDMFYQIFNPDGTFLLDKFTAAQEYCGQLWQSGDHVIEVINRGNDAQSYNVIFGID